jgi:hypothetical protein
MPSSGRSLRIGKCPLKTGRITPLARSELFALRERLYRIKTETLDEFASDDLGSKDLLFGFLLQVNDVRDYLTRLTLQAEESEIKVPVSSSAVDKTAPNYQWRTHHSRDKTAGSGRTV